MKKIFYFFLFLPLLIAGCSSDNDDWHNATADDIIGRWQLADVKVKVVNTNIPDVTKDLESIYLITTPIIEFKSGGVFVDGDGEEGYYEFIDNTIRIYENVPRINLKAGDVLINGEVKNKFSKSYSSNTNNGEVLNWSELTNVAIKGNRLYFDMDIKDEAQEDINSEYPYENIIIYDYVVTVSSVRK